MKLEFPDELIPAIAREFAAQPVVMAAVLKAEDDLLTLAEAAAILEVTKETLATNHIAWGLDKSVAFGLTNPRYFRSQINARAREKVVKGKKRTTTDYTDFSDGRRAA